MNGIWSASLRSSTDRKCWVQQGAGGMVMIDPAFQRALAQHCQQQNIPVILDEVFSGIWRLGHLSAAHMLNIKPDIACYAKLLTGKASN